jgi:hypothetical protein
MSWLSEPPLFPLDFLATQAFFTFSDKAYSDLSGHHQEGQYDRHRTKRIYDGGHRW